MINPVIVLSLPNFRKVYDCWLRVRPGNCVQLYLSLKNAFMLGGRKRKEHQGEAEALFCPKIIEDSFHLTLAFGLEGFQGLCSSAAL